MTNILNSYLFYINFILCLILKGLYYNLFFLFVTILPNFQVILFILPSHVFIVHTIFFYIKCNTCNDILLFKGIRKKITIQNDNKQLYYRFCSSCDKWNLYFVGSEPNNLLYCNCDTNVDDFYFNQLCECYTNKTFFASYKNLYIVKPIEKLSNHLKKY